MGSHGSISTELRLRAEDLKHFFRPKVVKGMTRSDIPYGRSPFDMEPLHGQEILAIVGRFRHRVDGSGILLSDSWERLTYDLAAVYGSVDDKALWFKGVTAHHLERWMNSRYCANDATTHLFTLGPGEFVRGVDVCWCDLKFVGVRLQTNQRQSQWFGHRTGIVKTVTAPQGYFINALVNLQPKTGAWELGLRLCPILEHCARPVSSGCLVTSKSIRVGKPGDSDGLQTEFMEMYEEIRAIIVSCGKNSIENLYVLSSEQFGRHLAKREDQLRSGQHLFYLRRTEYLTRVDVVATRVVHALRFHSNLSTSPWFGDPKSEGAHVHSFTTDSDNAQICGFHGAFGEKHLGSVGVYYHSPQHAELLKPSVVG
ncbi:hypothetical protein Poli38472_006666 [Pythium oligandrum]|uniref:Jacalin-type lectin domain-containing protein n=1 Tax=Pythium oligandrum TaxID=41045 RepID=A0A8K1FC03_PYTOL|nr:hypothetical protein Poli38472_006666 [Pythium oligandrum]|eukprot:TMW56656.1 hypothetical protein Poli38472_006666 [Pythium oligandrum]